MAFERTKSLLGIGGREKRYPDPEDYDEPQEHEDPHTTPDSTRMSVGEFLSRNSVSILAFVLLVVIGVIILAVYLGRYFITTLTNPWVQRGLAALGIASLGYFYGRNAKANALQNRDKLVLYNPDTRDVWRFLGEFRKANDGDHPVFYPIKGFSWFGHRPERYQVKDLSQELVARYNRDAEDDVAIRLHPTVSSAASTNTGRLTVQLCAGLRPDPFGYESNIEATLPDMAGEATVAELKDELGAANEELKKLRKETNMLRRQRNEALKEAEKPREDLRGELNDMMEMVYPFASGISGSVGDAANGQTKEERVEDARRQLAGDRDHDR